MNHSDHVRLLAGQPGARESLGLPIRDTGGVWADLGAGRGAFTLALADLLGPGARIYAIDRDSAALRGLETAMRKTFPRTVLETRAADFTMPLDLPALDGLVMANALHFVPYPRQPELLRRLKRLLRPGGQFVLVEYGTDQGNRWVPYPLSYHRWETLARECGYTQVTQLSARPSSFMGEIYSAAAIPARPKTEE